MPWSDHYDPPPPPEERRGALVSRIIALIVLGFILGWCGRSWFISSAVIGQAGGHAGSR